MSGYTPGPWFVTAWKVGFGVCTEPKGTYANRVAEITYWSFGDPKQPDRAAGKANAYLMAAAPEMLEALCGLVAKSTDVDGDWSREWAAALNAIAKATGV